MRIQTKDNGKGKVVARYRRCPLCKWRTVMNGDNSAAMTFGTEKEAEEYIRSMTAKRKRTGG